MVGPALYTGASRSRRATLVLHVGIVTAIVALVALDVLPHCVEVAGWWALAVVLAGLLGPSALEHGLHRVASPAQGVLVALGVLAILLHASLDGWMIAEAAAGAVSPTHDHDALLPAILLHRLPEGAALWWLVRPAGRLPAVAALTVESLGTCMGYAGAALVQTHLSGLGAALVEAFVAGILLHVLFHRHPGIPTLNAAQCPPAATPATGASGSGA
jgi:uncharacterized protein